MIIIAVLSFAVVVVWSRQRIRSLSQHLDNNNIFQKYLHESHAWAHGLMGRDDAEFRHRHQHTHTHTQTLRSCIGPFFNYGCQRTWDMWDVDAISIICLGYMWFGKAFIRQWLLSLYNVLAAAVAVAAAIASRILRPSRLASTTTCGESDGRLNQSNKVKVCRSS